MFDIFDIYVYTCGNVSTYESVNGLYDESVFLGIYFLSR